MKAPSGARWERVKELFEAAADLAPPERTGLLVRECGDDEELRREIESLLASDQEAKTFIEQPAFELPRDLFPASPDEPLTGRAIGPYRIIREIGRGGLGAVYLAARADDAYDKEVAIKLVRRGLDTEDILRRFRNERQILAQLDHPNIARLIDGGTTSDGLPYFVMEYVKGEPIAAYCEVRRLPVRDRLDLFRRVCAAVTYAHQNLVVHRDLKPSNILVTPEGEPKLLDFGIAKVLGAEEDLLARTSTGRQVLTPEYASPEQVQGEAMTTATDVYSLGILLYELLTGSRPYRLKTRGPDQIARAITGSAPQRPSTAVARADKSKIEIRNSKILEGDLDNIVLMALRKEPARRYASVAQFSEDIRRHLEGLPVVARQDTFGYRASKFVRRHRIGVAAAAVILLSLIGGIAATTWQATIARRERDRARRQAAKAERVTMFLQNVLGFSDPGWASSNPKRNRDATVSQAMTEAARRAESELADEPEALAAVHFTLGTTYRVQGLFAEAEPHLRAALEIRRRILGSKNRETAQSMVALAEWCVVSARYPDAEPLLRDALAVFRETNDTKWLAITLNDWGALEETTGNYVAAEMHLREGLEVSAKLSGADRAPRAIMFSLVGTARAQQGDLGGAAALLEQSIEEHRALPGETRSELAYALQSLGSLRLVQGDYDRAETLLQEALDLFNNTVGENHPSTANVLTTLADVHFHRTNYEKARGEIEKAIAIQERVLPPGHVDVNWSRVILAKIEMRTNDPQKAETDLRSAIDKLAGSLSKEHPLVASARGALGECLCLQKRYADAEALLLESHKVLLSRLGPRDPRTQNAAQRLVALYDAWEKPDEAARFRTAP